MTGGPSLVTHHPSLITLRRRVRCRQLLDRLRSGLLWASAGDILLAAGGRTLGYSDWPLVVAAWTALALAAAVALALRRWPDDWRVAVAADGLGLAERVTSALHAARVGHPATQLLAADAAGVLPRINPADYPLLSNRRVRRLEAAALLCLALAAFLPLPALGDGERRTADAGAVAAARKSLASVETGLAAATPEPLVQAAAEGLKASEQQLAEARTAEEAARILEQAQERLAGQGKAEDYAWQRAMDGLSSVWRDSPSLGTLARAIGAGDQKTVERTAADLAQRAEAMAPEEKQELKLALQAGANAARDVPDLAGSLRRAAGQVGQAGGSDTGGQGGAAGAMGDVASLLERGMSRSAGLQAVQQATAAVGQARAGLGPVAGSAVASGALASGPVSGSASGGRAGSGSGAQAGSGSGSGSGTGSGSGSGSGGSGSGGGGSGSGSGSGSGGTGGSGGGAGAGAGAGGGASSGQPGSGSAGATLAGGSAAPSLRGATNYDPVYAPSLMGGGDGPRMDASGGAQGASGETVELPDSPLELGSVRPYDEVYGRYEAAARQSLSRQPLPPSLQGLVQRYFSAIAPDGK